MVVPRFTTRNIVLLNFSSKIWMLYKHLATLQFSKWGTLLKLGGVMLNRIKQQIYITEKIKIVHVFLPQAKQHAELKNVFADFMKHT